MLCCPRFTESFVFSGSHVLSQGALRFVQGDDEACEHSYEDRLILLTLFGSLLPIQGCENVANLLRGIGVCEERP